MNKKLKLALLATTISIALAGCSSDDTSDGQDGDGQVDKGGQTGNIAPLLTVTSGNSVNLEENNTVVVNYNVADEDKNHNESNLSVSYELLEIEENELIGDLVLDTTSKTLTYSVENIQEDYSFSVLLNVVDPEGENSSNSAEERTVTFSVVNSENEVPQINILNASMEDGVAEIVVEGTSSPNKESHEVVIPFSVKDLDNDKLTFSVSQISGLEEPSVEIVEQDGNSGVIVASFKKEYVLDGEGSFTLTADDKNEASNAMINILVEKTEVSPTINIKKNEVSSGVIPYKVNEESNISIAFTTEDLNNDEVFVKGSLSDRSVITDFEPNISGNSIDLNGFNVTEDTLLTLTLTANDRTGMPVATDTVEIEIIDTINLELNEINEEITLEREKFTSMNSRNDELELFGFYTDYLTLTEKLNEDQRSGYLLQLETGRKNEITTIEKVISEIETEQAKPEDEQDLSFLSSKLEELKTSNNQIGMTGIGILNIFSEMDSELPRLDKVNTIYLSNEDTKQYSRYVGNSELGIYDNNITWSFLQDFEVLEIVNFMSGECN